MQSAWKFPATSPQLLIPDRLSKGRLRRHCGMASPPWTHPIVSAGSLDMRKWGVPLFSNRELTTALTTTMTTVGLPDTSTHTTIELESCLFAPSARAYGSKGRLAARRQPTHQYDGALDITGDHIGAAQWHWPTSPGPSNQRSGRRGRGHTPSDAAVRRPPGHLFGPVAQY